MYAWTSDVIESIREVHVLYVTCELRILGIVKIVGYISTCTYHLAPTVSSSVPETGESQSSVSWILVCRLLGV